MRRPPTASRASASASIAAKMASTGSHEGHICALFVCAGREATRESDFACPRVSSSRRDFPDVCGCAVACCWTLFSARRATGCGGAAGLVSWRAVVGEGETVVAGAEEAGCDAEWAARCGDWAGACRAGGGAGACRAGGGAGAWSGFGTGAGSGFGGPPAASAGAVQDKPIAAQQAATNHIALERNPRSSTGQTPLPFSGTRLAPPVVNRASMSKTTVVAVSRLQRLQVGLQWRGASSSAPARICTHRRGPSAGLVLLVRQAAEALTRLRCRSSAR